MLAPLLFVLSISAEHAASVGPPDASEINVVGMASNDDELLVVWNTRSPSYPTQYRLHAGRVDGNGQLLDAPGLDFPDSPLSQFSATVAADADGFVVAWSEFGYSSDPNIYGAVHPFPLYVARVSAAGEWVGAPVLVAADIAGEPQLACANHTCWLTWLEAPDPLDPHMTPGVARASRVAADGTLLDVPGLPLAPSGEADLAAVPVCARDRDECLLVWPDGDAVLGRRFGSDGTPLGSGPTAIPWSLPSNLVSDGTDYLAVYIRDDVAVGSGGHYYAARIAGDATVLDDPGLVLSGPWITGFSSAFFDGDDYVFAWGESRPGWNSAPGGYLARLARDGSLVGPAGGASSRSGFVGNGACLSSGVCGFATSSGVSFLPTGGLPGPPINLGVASSDQHTPAVAAGAGDALAVWTEWRNLGESSLHAARISPDGTSRDPQAIALDASGGQADNATTAWDGAGWDVAWLAGFPPPSSGGPSPPVTIATQHVGADGAVGPLRTLDANVLIWNPTVACDGAACLALWCHSTTMGDGQLTAAKLVNGVPGAPFAVDAPCGQLSATAAGPGLGYLVSWSDAGGVHALRLDSEGASLGTHVVAVSSASYGATAASDGAGFLVVWSATTDIPGQTCHDFMTERCQTTDAFARRLDANGAPLGDVIAIETTVFDSSAPRVAWDGASWLVAYAFPEWPCADPLAVSCGSTGGLDLQAVRLSQRGVILDGAPIVVSAEAYDEAEPVVVAAPGDRGAGLFVYRRYDPSAGVDADRIQVRSFSGDEAALDGDPPAAVIASVDGGAPADGGRVAPGAAGSSGGGCAVTGPQGAALPWPLILVTLLLLLKRTRPAAVLAILLVAGAARADDTCGVCSADHPTLISPADFERDVPLDGEISLRWQGQPVAGVATAFALRADSGDVPFTTELVPWSGGWIVTERLHPSAPLAAETRYQVIFSGAAGEEVLGAFTTSSSRSEGLPNDPDDGPSDLPPAHACGDQCCPASSGALVDGIMSTPSYPGLATVTFVVRDGAFPEAVLAADVVGPVLGVIACQPATYVCPTDLRYLLPGEAVVWLSVAARDRAGRESARSYIESLSYCQPLPVDAGGPPPVDGGIQTVTDARLTLEPDAATSGSTDSGLVVASDATDVVAPDAEMAAQAPNRTTGGCAVGQSRGRGDTLVFLLVFGLVVVTRRRS